MKPDIDSSSQFSCYACKGLIKKVKDYFLCPNCGLITDGESYILKTNIWTSEESKLKFLYNLILSKKGVITFSELIEQTMEKPPKNTSKEKKTM
ncbi:MAG: hypothetical protein ACXACK_07455 [Candidatus Hodarchaeales archaeon]|jgi:predicted RNA-binding Zn-ribbon protein involved in translation (DUF1610 family)